MSSTTGVPAGPRPDRGSRDRHSPARRTTGPVPRGTRPVLPRPGHRAGPHRARRGRRPDRRPRSWSTAPSWPPGATGASSSGARFRHGETDRIEVAGRLPASSYRRATMATTLSPCDMCTGAILLYGIPRLVIGENRTFVGGEELLRSRGVEVDQPRLRRVLRPDAAASSPSIPRSGTRTSGRSRDEHVGRSSRPRRRRGSRHRPGLPGHDGSRARAQVVLLRRRGAARLHGLHADDARRCRARSGVRLRPAAAGHRHRVAGARHLRGRDGVDRRPHRADHRRDGALHARHARRQAVVGAARRHPGRLVRRRRRHDRRPHGGGARLGVLRGPGRGHGGDQRADVRDGLLGLRRHVLGVAGLHAR